MRVSIELKKTRDGCAMMEREPRYDVMLHGKKVGQLYYNLRGYVGELPTPGGRVLVLGEKGITAYQKEVRCLNREFAQKG